MRPFVNFLLQRLKWRFGPYLSDYSLPTETLSIYHYLMMRRSQDGSNRFNEEPDLYCSDVHLSPHLRLIYLLLGWCFFGLGALGAALPGLPTTPFMLLALWAFSKSSRRFHHWLYAHPFFGPPLQQWCTYRVIPLKAKVLSIVMMVLSFVYLAFFTSIDLWIKVAIAAVMLFGAYYILSKPSRVSDAKSTLPFTG
jgi:uncharacterized membrane protein YbaN (DUF454 family)